MRAARLSSLGVLLSAALAVAEARAQAGPQSPQAEALFQEGRELMKRAQYAEACARLGESQRIEPKLGTLLNLALCHEKEGKIATAWAEYGAAAAIALHEGQKEREDVARAQQAALEKILPRVRITTRTRSPEGLTLTLDGAPITAAAPVPIDPGRHRLDATAPGKKAWSTTLEIPAPAAPDSHTEIDLEIPPLEDASPPLPAPQPPPALRLPPGPAFVPPTMPMPVVVPPQAPPPARSTWPLVYAGFGVGGAGLVAGAITGIAAMVKAGPVVKACTGGHCPAGEAGALGTVDTLATASNVGFAIAGVGVAAGVVGVVLSRQPAAPRAGAAVTPFLGPGSIGLAGRF